MIAAPQLHDMDESQLRDLAKQLLQRIERDAHEIGWRDAKLEKLTFEMAHLKRIKFGKSSEQMDAAQKALFDEGLDRIL